MSELNETQPAKIATCRKLKFHGGLRQVVNHTYPNNTPDPQPWNRRSDIKHCQAERFAVVLP
ncbi:hypothetical protein DSUL_140015 [Desulfovibrionales bacterium]